MIKRARNIKLSLIFFTASGSIFAINCKYTNKRARKHQTCLDILSQRAKVYWRTFANIQISEQIYPKFSYICNHYLLY